MAGYTGDQAAVPSAETISLTFQSLDGWTSKPHNFKGSDKIYALAHHVKEVKEWKGAGIPQLSWQGFILPAGASVIAAGLKDGATLDVVRSNHKQYRSLPRDNDPIARRKPPSDLSLSAETEKLDLSGCKGISPSLLPPLLSTSSLQVLDVRQCRLDEGAINNIFQSLPAGLQVLRASRNKISGRALQSLASRSLCLKVLDIGYSECDGFAALPELVTDKLEELIIGDLEDLSSETLEASVRRCPHLKIIDISFILGEVAAAALEALILHCPELQEVQAYLCCCPAGFINALVANCHKLHTLVIGMNCNLLYPLVIRKSDAPSLATTLATHVGWSDVRINCSSFESLLSVSNIESDFLALGVEGTPELDSAGAQQIAKSLEKSCTHWFELCLPVLDEAMLRAVGPRLQSISATNKSPRYDDYSLVSLLSSVPECCINLVHLEVRFYEQIDAKQLAVVAKACPLLERLTLSADHRAFQKQAIDEGVLALGQHCHNMEAIDLYDRVMARPSATLAVACEGWPKLRYLSIAGTLRKDLAASNTEKWDEEDREMRLAQALASHCPCLEELVIDDDSVMKSWAPVLHGGCPLFF